MNNLQTPVFADTIVPRMQQAFANRPQAGQKRRFTEQYCDATRSDYKELTAFVSQL